MYLLRRIIECLFQQVYVYYAILSIKSNASCFQKSYFYLITKRNSEDYSMIRICIEITTYILSGRILLDHNLDNLGKVEIGLIEEKKVQKVQMQSVKT